jgi:hypothetical protein
MLFGLRFIDICGRSQRRALIERFAFERQPHRSANGNAPADTRPTAVMGSRYATAH